MLDSTTQLYIKHAQTIPPKRADELKGEPLTFIEAPQVLTDTQETALDLYRRGFNVIPIRYKEKKPYVLKPLFTARLHDCEILGTCKHKGIDSIAGLFVHTNIGLIVGRTSGNLFAIDCESPAAFREKGNELTQRMIPFWAYTSARGGVYLCRVIEGEVHNIPKTKMINCKDVEVWGNRHFVVIPPSLHPSGVSYQWHTPEPRFHFANKFDTLPAVSITAFDWLGLQLEKEARAKWEAPELFGLPAWAEALSLSNRRAYGNADELKEGDGRNIALFALLCDMHGNGIDYYEAETVADEFARRCDLDDNETRQILKNAYSQERTAARGNGEGVRTWQLAKAWAESLDWAAEFGRQALTRRAAFLACVERARLEGRELWRAVVREVAEIAGLNKETAAAALRDLAARKFIKRVNATDKAKRKGEAAVYRFGVFQFRTLGTTGSYSVRILNSEKTTAEADIFTKLGKVAGAVWTHLLTHPEPTTAAIAHALKMPRTSVYQAVRKLQDESLKMIGRGGDGNYYAEPRTPASMQYLAAQMFNGGSPTQARKENHKVERERRNNQLIAYKQRRES